MSSAINDVRGSAYAQRPEGYVLRESPMITCSAIEAEDLEVCDDERAGGVVAMTRVIMGSAIVVVAERRDGVVNAVAWRITRRDPLERATARARAKCVEWLFRRALLGTDAATR